MALWPRGSSSLKLTAFWVSEGWTSFPRSLVLQGPLVQSSALLDWGVGGGARALLLFPPQTWPSLPAHCRNSCPGSSNPQSSSLGESLSEGQRGPGSAEGCGGETNVGVSGGEPMGTGGRGDTWLRCPAAFPGSTASWGPGPLLPPPLPQQGHKPLCHRKAASHCHQ